MLKLSGEKLYLVSGIASATSTICFSIALSSRSMADAMVGSSVRHNADALKIGSTSSITIRVCVIESISELCLAKRKHQVYFHRATCGKIAGQNCDTKQKQRHGQRDNG